MSGFFFYVSNMSESVPALDISDGLNRKLLFTDNIPRSVLLGTE